jgi:hypothetical protein
VNKEDDTGSMSLTEHISGNRSGHPLKPVSMLQGLIQLDGLLA